MNNDVIEHKWEIKFYLTNNTTISYFVYNKSKEEVSSIVEEYLKSMKDINNCLNCVDEQTGRTLFIKAANIVAVEYYIYHGW